MMAEVQAYEDRSSNVLDHLNRWLDKHPDIRALRDELRTFGLGFDASEAISSRLRELTEVEQHLNAICHHYNNHVASLKALRKPSEGKAFLVVETPDIRDSPASSADSIKEASRPRGIQNQTRQIILKSLTGTDDERVMPTVQEEQAHRRGRGDLVSILKTTASRAQASNRSSRSVQDRTPKPQATKKSIPNRSGYSQYNRPVSGHRVQEVQVQALGMRFACKPSNQTAEYNSTEAKNKGHDRVSSEKHLLAAVDEPSGPPSKKNKQETPDDGMSGSQLMSSVAGNPQSSAGANKSSIDGRRSPIVRTYGSQRSDKSQGSEADANGRSQSQGTMFTSGKGQCGQ